MNREIIQSTVHLHANDAGQFAEEVLAHDALVVHQAGHGGPEGRGTLLPVHLLDLVGVVDEEQIGAAYQTAQPHDLAVLVVEHLRDLPDVRDLVLADQRQQPPGVP